MIGRNRSCAPLSAAWASGSALGPLAAGELDHQDRVLGRHRDHQDDADLAVHVVGEAARDHAADHAQQRQRHGQDHGEGIGPALVEGGQDQIDQQDREREDEDRLVADDLLLVGHAGPGVADVRRQAVGGGLRHQVHGLAGAEARAPTTPFRPTVG